MPSILESLEPTDSLPETLFRVFNDEQLKLIVLYREKPENPETMPFTYIRHILNDVYDGTWMDEDIREAHTILKRNHKANVETSERNPFKWLVENFDKNVQTRDRVWIPDIERLRRMAEDILYRVYAGQSDWTYDKAMEADESTDLSSWSAEKVRSSFLDRHRRRLNAVDHRWMRLSERGDMYKHYEQSSTAFELQKGRELLAKAQEERDKDEANLKAER
ncbi:MAG: hypothetical protein LQ344_007411 [Seirophora lacunosa]|nr:MAG: hypothetical protein LQ344_007411 [Seirophora lacunosa]